MRVLMQVIILLLFITACAHNTTITMQDFTTLKALSIPAPVAKRVSHDRIYHGKTLTDPYFWMKDQGYPEVDDQDVLDYLNAENDYYQEFLKPHADLVETIFQEFKGRTDEQETSVPYVYNGYEYRWFYRPGEEYRVRSRKNLANGVDQVFLDEAALAEGHEYFVLGDWDITRDNRYLAYSYDTAGDERYTVKVIDLETGDYLGDVLEDVQGQIDFGADGKTLLYALLEQDRWHSKEIKVHTLGLPQSRDVTIYEEADDGFFIGAGLTSSEEYVLIVSSQGEVQETWAWALPANDLMATPVKLVGREQGFSQSIDHAHDHFYILANDTHKNFRLARVSDQEPVYQDWDLTRFT